MSASSRPVSEIMQVEVVTLGPDERLDLADDIMRLGRVRHMPVVENGKLVGLVSNRDLMAASLSRFLDFERNQRRTFLRSIDVREAMSEDVVAVEPKATLREAAELMVQHKVGCLPVVKPDRVLVGLVTESDLLQAALLRDDAEVIVEEEKT